MASNGDRLLRELGCRLTDLRRSRRLSQQDVAARLGMKRSSGHSYVSRLEQGQLRNVGFLTVISFIRACGVEPGAPDELLDRLGLPRSATGSEPVRKKRTTPSGARTDQLALPPPVVPPEDPADELRRWLTPLRNPDAPPREPTMYWQMMSEVHVVLDRFLCDQPGDKVSLSDFSLYKTQGRRAIGFYRRYPPEQALAKLEELRASWVKFGPVRAETCECVAQLALQGWHYWVAKVGEAALKPAPRKRRRSRPNGEAAEKKPPMDTDEHGSEGRSRARPDKPPTDTDEHRQTEPRAEAPPAISPEARRDRMRRLERRIQSDIADGVRPIARLPIEHARPYLLPVIQDVSDKFYATWKRLMTQCATPEHVRFEFDRIAARYHEMGLPAERVAAVRAVVERVLKIAGGWQLAG
jgi:transcriptional regulator with XRE-family HTH domain